MNKLYLGSVVSSDRQGGREPHRSLRSGGSKVSEIALTGIAGQQSSVDAWVVTSGRYLGNDIMRAVNLHHVLSTWTVVLASLSHHNRKHWSLVIIVVLPVVVIVVANNVQFSLWILNFFRVFIFLTDEEERVSVDTLR